MLMTAVISFLNTIYPPTLEADNSRFCNRRQEHQCERDCRHEGGVKKCKPPFTCICNGE